MPAAGLPDNPRTSWRRVGQAVEIGRIRMHRSSKLLVPALLCCFASAALAGCPAKVPEDQAQAGDKTPPGVPITPPDDPRVTRDTDDLYAVDEDDPTRVPTPPPPTPAPGSGRPDETNGECRLFAPKLPEPNCCKFETGFDAEKIRELCGHEVYLGESIQHSCGYFFLPDMGGSHPVSLRTSKLQHTDMATAVKEHDERMRFTTKNPAFASTPVPGVEGAWWSNHEGLYWALLPGWKVVRQVSWSKEACSEEAMPKVLALIAAAKEPPPNAPRPGLIPVARQ